MVYSLLENALSFDWLLVGISTAWITDDRKLIINGQVRHDLIYGEEINLHVRERRLMLTS